MPSPCPAAAARHRDRAVDVLQPGDARALQRNRRKLLTPPRGVDLELNDLDLDVVPDRVVRADRAIDAPAVVETAIHVLQEIGGRGRRANGVDLHLNRTLLGLEDDDRVSLRPGLLARGAGQNRNGQQRPNHSDRHRQPSSVLRTRMARRSQARRAPSRTARAGGSTPSRPAARCRRPSPAGTSRAPRPA